MKGDYYERSIKVCWKFISTNSYRWRSLRISMPRTSYYDSNILKEYTMRHGLFDLLIIFKNGHRSIVPNVENCTLSEYGSLFRVEKDGEEFEIPFSIVIFVGDIEEYFEGSFNVIGLKKAQKKNNCHDHCIRLNVKEDQSYFAKVACIGCPYAKHMKQWHKQQINHIYEKEN